MSTNAAVTTLPDAPATAALTTRSSREHELQVRLVDLCAQASRCVVNSEETAEKATSLAVAIKANERALEEDRTSITGPLNGVIKDINARYKLLAGPIAPALENLTGRRGQITLWNIEKQRKIDEAARLERERIERQRLEDARLAEEEAARLRAEGDAEGAAIADQQAEAALEEAVAPPPITAPAAVTRGIVGGSSGLTSVGKFEVVNMVDLLLWELDNVKKGRWLQYVLVNESELGKLARKPEKEAKPEIPGVRWFRESVTRTW